MLPVRARSVATARPLRASPITAISCFSQSARNAGVETRAIARLPQLERAQGYDGKHDLDDPEAHDNLRLVPTFELEVVMQWGSQQ